MKGIITEILNTPKQIGNLVDLLILRYTPPELYSPTIYIDLEGVDLCREGSLSILTLLIDTDFPTRRVYLIDIHTLGAQAFNTVGAKRTTLKDVLQDFKIPKVFFDVRNDSDAMFAHFGVSLQGVEDVQLMESATRKTTASREFLTGLAKCIEINLPITPVSKLAQWKLAKQKGERLFKAEHGGSYEVFNQRPIPEDIISYCVSDVQYLPELRNKFWQQTERWRVLIGEETKKRVAMSQRSDYQPHGSDRAIAPWSKEQHMVLDQWYYAPPPHEDSDGLDDFEDFFDEDDDWSDDWFDDGPTSCRDIISSCDHDYYYSD
ncbi:hypothetical protein T440DRAFT_409643 [Plenodomus tracheiphilus IPT5]|uniref:3'-5' exonuclease domain-containing protein n=1 Tax=Plenodomus tracheiphilus IPT5 TaxID=1408161 RepID=A0A6A7ANM0_9PLEO|nr:hypothetical protein T440DRAFT_409643 [Plenodomus tracheiphilus IPT5]